MSSKCGEAQSSMVVLIAMVSVFVVLWLFLSFKGMGSRARMIREIELQKLSTYLDLTKGFSRGSLILSVHAAVNEIARNGGDTNPSGFARTWVCNGADVSPSVDEVRFFLSSKTLELLNSYVKNFGIEDLPDVRVTGFDCVDYNVNESTVSSGKNDEMFNVGAYGSSVSVGYKEDRITSKNDVYETITQNRFWYLYRGFKEWVKGGAQTLIRCLCNCMPLICECGWVNGGCAQECEKFRKCALSCLRSAAGELESMFDGYVNCDAQLTCCIVGSGDLCKNLPRGCIVWRDPPDCYFCVMESAGKLCSLEYIPRFAAGDQNGCNGTCLSWWYGKAALMADLFCEDRKFVLSTKGERALKFNIGFTYHRMLRCEMSDDCGCYNDECECPPIEPPLAWCSESCRGKCQNSSTFLPLSGKF